MKMYRLNKMVIFQPVMLVFGGVIKIFAFFFSEKKPHLITQRIFSGFLWDFEVNMDGWVFFFGRRLPWVHDIPPRPSVGRYEPDRSKWRVFFNGLING